MNNVNQESLIFYSGSYSSAVLSRGSLSESSTSSHVGSVTNSWRDISKDRPTTRSMMDATGQEVVADCDLEPTKQPVEKVIDETADKMRESRDQLQDINMDTLPPSGTAALGGNPDSFTPTERGAVSQGMNIHSQFALEVGDMAEIPLSDGRSTRYGVIKWIGNLPELNGKLVAGLELVSDPWELFWGGRRGGGFTTDTFNVLRPRLER